MNSTYTRELEADQVDYQESQLVFVHADPESYAAVSVEEAMWLAWPYWLQLQCNSPPPPTSYRTNTRCTSPPTDTPMCPEGVAWAAMSYAGPRDVYFLWDQERHRTSKPGRRGVGCLSSLGPRLLLHLQPSPATHITCTYTYGAPLTEIPMYLEGVAWAAMSYARPQSGSDLPSTFHATPPRTTQHVPPPTFHSCAECWPGSSEARGYVGRLSGMRWYDGWLHSPRFRAYGMCSFDLR